MAPLTPDQLRTRQRVEGLIRLMAPALDLVLAVGERISRIVEPEDVEYYPPRVTRARRDRPAAQDAVNREEQLQWEARWAVPAAIAAFVAGGDAPGERGCSSSPRTARASSPTPTSCSRSTSSPAAYLASARAPRSPRSLS